jgi:hypothetical protein
MRRAASRAMSILGGSADSVHRQVLALVTIPAIGWLTPCAIDAVKFPHSFRDSPIEFTCNLLLLTQEQCLLQPAG